MTRRSRLAHPLWVQLLQSVSASPDRPEEGSLLFKQVGLLTDVAKLSGGNSYRFLDYNRNDSRHSKRFEETLRRYLSREIGWNTTFEQKVHPGFKVIRFFGNHSHDPDERQRTDLPVVHTETNFGFELSLDENIPVHVERVCFQVALHYTTPIGQNRTRIHTVAVPVTDSLLAVAISVDQQCLAAYLTKLTIEELLALRSGTYVLNGTVQQSS